MSTSRPGTKLFVAFITLGGAVLLAQPFRQQRTSSVRLVPQAAEHVVLRETPVPGAADALRPDAPTAEIQPTLLAPPKAAAEPPRAIDEFPRIAPPPSMARSFPNSATFEQDEVGLLDSSRQRSIQRTHKVRDGDTLESLAQLYLGDRTRWQEIFRANRDRIQHPEPLPLATTLAIPPRHPQPSADLSMETGSKDVSQAPLVPLRQ